MKNSTRNRRISTGSVAFAGLLILLTATACGGQPLSAADNNVQDDQGQFTVMPAPSEDLAKSVLDKIKPNTDLNALLPEAIRSDGVIQMTTSEGYPPMELFAQDGKTLIGVDPSLGRALANKLGVEINIANEDFNAQIPGITTGRYDILMSSMTDNEERRKTVTFVDYVSAGSGWVVKSGNPADMGTPETACGKTVAVVDNGSSLNLVEGFDADCKAAGKDAIEVLKFSGDQDAILQVRNDRADAGINDFPVAAYRAQNSEGALEAISIEGDTSPWGIAINPANEELVEAVQKALQELIDEGSYAKVLESWNVSEMAIPTATVNNGK